MAWRLRAALLSSAGNNPARPQLSGGRAYFARHPSARHYDPALALPLRGAFHAVGRPSSSARAIATVQTPPKKGALFQADPAARFGAD